MNEFAHNSQLLTNAAPCPFPGAPETMHGFEVWSVPMGTMLYRGNPPGRYRDETFWLTHDAEAASWYAVDESESVYQYVALKNLKLFVMNPRNLNFLVGYGLNSRYVQQVTGLGLNRNAAYQRHNPSEIQYKRRDARLMQIHANNALSAENLQANILAHSRLAREIHRVLPRRFDGWIYPIKVYPQANGMFDNLLPHVMESFHRAKGQVASDRTG